MMQVRRMTAEDLPAMQRLFERERLRHNGWVGRTEWEWRENVVEALGRSEWPGKVEGAIVPGEAGEVEGYLLYTLAPSERASMTARKDRAVEILEWVSGGAPAWRALAGFVAAQRAQAELVRYTAPAGFPLLHALRERETFRDRRTTEFAFRDTLSLGAGLMGRIVHLEKALSQRGYPAAARGECVVGMYDPLLPANGRPLRLQIEDGHATVTETERSPTARADALTWSELYAGALSPQDARTLGRLDTDDATAAFLTVALQGEPWFVPRADWF